MITLNNIESQIVYYCKNWFKDRENPPYTDFRILTAKWAGIDGVSSCGDCCVILMELLKKLKIREDQWTDIILAMMVGNRWYLTDTYPIERFINKFTQIVGQIQVRKDGETLISLEPLDLTIFDKRN